MSSKQSPAKRLSAKPSQRMKKRYVLFKYTVKPTSFKHIEGLLLHLNVGSIKLVEFHGESGFGIVKCKRGKERALREAMNEVGLETIKTSGSLKKLRGIRPRKH